MSRSLFLCLDCVLVVGFILIGAAGCSTQPATGAGAEGFAVDAAAGPTADDDLVTVMTLLPERVTLRRTTTQPATIRAYYQAEVYAQAAGYLESLNVDIGQQVEAGEVLGTIAVPEMVKSREKQQATIRRLQADQQQAEAGIAVAQASVESAKAHLQQAQADALSSESQLKADHSEYDRVDELVRSKAVAERLRDEALQHYEAAQAAKASADAAIVSARADLGVAEAKLQAARADSAAAAALTEVAVKELEELDALMDYATLRSPFDGIVIQRRADPGDLIRDTPTSSGRDSPPLFVIAQLDRVRVTVVVPQNDAPWANEGDPVSLAIQELPGQRFEGKIDRIARSLDESTRTMTVEIDLPNPEHHLLPGMYGEATIELDSKDNALILPAGAVRYDDDGQSQVYVVAQDNTVAVVDVATGLDDGKRIEILSGLEDDARVIDAMVTPLASGQPVRVQKG